MTVILIIVCMSQYLFYYHDIGGGACNGIRLAVYT